MEDMFDLRDDVMAWFDQMFFDYHMGVVMVG